MLFTHRDQKIITTLGITDTLSVIFSWYMAYWLRFHIMPGGEEGLLPAYTLLLSVMLSITIIFYIREQLYEIPSFRSWFRNTLSVFKAHFKSLAIFILFVYFVLPFQVSRLTLAFYAILAGIVLPINRILLFNHLLRRRKRGLSLTSLLIVGNGYHVEEFVESMLARDEPGLRIIGWIDGNGSAKRHGVQPVERSSMLNFVRQAKPDRIVIGYDGEKRSLLEESMRTLEADHHHIFLIPEFEYNLIGYTVEEVGGIPLIHTHSPGLRPYDHFIKRIADIGMSIVGLILLSPLLLTISLLVVLTSRGPILYNQTRITLDGRRFSMHKFRTMKVDADQVHSGWTQKDDERITWLGRFLRQTSLDELPQLWNVLKGDMSVVGPRPERPHLVEHFKEAIPNYIYRHRMKSGITGWAQVNGWRGNSSIRRRIEYDIYYIEHWSVLLDFKILLMTFYKGFVNENAY